VAIGSLISPYAADRERVRQRHLASGVPFFEIYVNTPIEECERRDYKGLYARSRSGQISGLTGVDDPYEPPIDPDFEFAPSDGSPLQLARRVITLVEPTPGPRSERTPTAPGRST
jgi:bifunctional enzyme CysN/CysC